MEFIDFTCFVYKFPLGAQVRMNAVMEFVAQTVVARHMTAK